MSRKYKKNLDGWVAHLDEAGLPTKKWTGEIRINKELKKKKQGQTDKKRKKQTLKLELDTDQGDYYVYEPGSETPIYRYNPRVDKVTISDEEKFEEYFVGDKNKEKQLEKIRKNALSSILALAESEYDRAAALRLNNDEPRRDDKRLKRILEKLEKKKGFKSLNNTAEPAEIAEVTSQDKGKKDKGPNTPKDGKVSANVDVELSINTASGGSGVSGGSGGGGGSVQNSGSGNRIDTESDIVKTSIVSLEMPIETPPVAAINDGSMRYPVIPPPFGYDHIRITAYAYVESGLSKQQAETTKDLKKRFTKSLGDVVLPMQPNLSETNSIDWGGDKINALQVAAAGVAMSGIEKLGDLDVVGAVTGMAGQTMGEIKKALADPATKQAVAAYFAGQAVGANVLTRTTGTVINPNLELLFSGPRLRTFNFNFNLTPRSDDEAIMIRRIIRFFKKTSTPSISSSGNFLQTPSVYLLEYIFDQDDGGQHPYLNKFKPCALTSFNVNYTPDGSYSTYKTGSMTSYSITMSFGELQPIYAGDYINSSGDDMGF